MFFFSVAVVKYLDQSNVGRKCLLRSQFQVKVHRGREVTAIGVWKKRSHYVYSREKSCTSDFPLESRGCGWGEGCVYWGRGRQDDELGLQLSRAESQSQWAPAEDSAPAALSLHVGVHLPPRREGGPQCSLPHGGEDEGLRSQRTVELLVRTACPFQAES